MAELQNSNDKSDFIEKYAFFTRYLFSCLTDADFLDTERFCNPDIDRNLRCDSKKMEQAIDDKFKGFTADTPLKKARNILQKQAIINSDSNKQISILNMPTGSGKTLCSMKIAINKMIKHQKKRIIYVIPYTSIIEQTAEVFENIFGEYADIVQHHSNYCYDTENDSTAEKLKRSTENWDAPIIITTSVQFFQSLYHYKGSGLRKLHNMADAVIVFDEIHMIPLECLQPCLRGIGYTQNKSRICQKFIYRGHFGEMLNNLIKHQNDLCINEKNVRPVYFSGIAEQLISPKSNKDKVPSSLMASIMLAALNNTKYPDSLLSTVVRRIKTDSDEEGKPYIKLNDTRAGIIKACLNRKYKKEEITMAWNEENKNPAYLCGGLFAVYEKIQQDSTDGTLNRTIKDSYFASACSRPASVFPKLAKLANNHMRKLSEGTEIYYSKMIGEITNNLEGEFPPTLNLDDQGRFIVGYYQMNKKLYTSLND